MSVPERRFSSRIIASLLVLLTSVPAVLAGPALKSNSQETARTLTPRQREIVRQQERLNSPEIEERRDAAMKLGLMHHLEASRAVIPALKDLSPAVRVAAAKSVLALPSSESVALLIPLLADSDEFVRREAAYALGLTRSSAAVGPLTERLLIDKKDGVRAAAAVALGWIADDSAVPALVQVISGKPTMKVGKSKPKPEKNEFVLRAAATALGEIRSAAAVPTLVAALRDEKVPSDIKREAARSLGLIGDPAAVPSLQAASTSGDPYLCRTAVDALKRIAQASQRQPR